MSGFIGHKVTMLRKDLGFTLQQLADKIGSTKSYVWDLENKPFARPSAEKICNLADALNVTADYLMDDTCKTKPNPEDKDKAFFSKYQSLDDRDKVLLQCLIKSMRDLT